MCSVDRGSAVAPLAEGVETVSPVIPAPAAHSYEKCAACGTICRPNRSPQLLPCLHSVCKVCIPIAGVGESKRECPSCKRSYNILEVTDNPLLKDSATGPGTHPLTKCAGCEDTAISSWCVECGEALCSICVSAHQRVRVTREHTVLPQKLPTGFIPTSFCPTHREEPMKLFCVSCSQLTCRDCQLTYHRNHSYQFLDEAVTAQRKEIESLMVKVRLQRETVKQTLQDLDGRLQDLEEIKSRTKSKLQKMLIYIRCALMKRTAELFKNVQDLCGREAQKITERQNNLRTLEERQEYILSFTGRALQMENHSALLSCKRQVHSQLQDLLSQSATPPASMIDVKLHFEQEGYFQISAFGKVVSSEVPFFRKNHDSVPKKSSPPPVPRQNVHPPPSSYQPYSSTVPTPSSSPSPLASPQITPTSVCQSSVSPPQSSAPSVSTVTSCAPLACVSQSSTASSPSSVYYSLFSTPPPTYSACTQPSAPSPPGSVPPPLTSQSQPSRKRRNKLTWSFHPYQPKNSKPAAPQPNSCSPEPPQQPAVVGPPAPSSLAAASERQSPPVSVLPAPSPTSVMVLFPLGPNVLEASPEQWNGRSGTTAAPQGPRAEGPSVEPDREELQSRAQPCALPVKAPADSPCERAPPAGCERPADPSHPATENEPTSTVAETDAAPPVGPPPAEGAGLSRGAESPASRGAGDACASFAGGTSAHIAARVAAARWSSGHSPALPARARHGTWATAQPRSAAAAYPAFGCSLQTREEVRVQSGPQPHLTSALTVRKDPPGVPFSTQYGSKQAQEPRFQPMKTPHEEGKASDVRNANPESAVNQQAPPTRTQPIQIPVHRLEKCTAWLPSSLKEILEMPSSDPALADFEACDKNPLLRKLLLTTPSAEFAPTDQVDYRGSPVETEKTDDDDEDGQDSVDTVVKSENEESGRPVSSPRHWLPLVSVMRLPVTVPPSDQPLPQFRLLPGVTEDEILLQVIEDDDQFPDIQSAQAAKRRPAPHRSDQTKAKLIVLRGPLANPTQPRTSHQGANHCSAQQQPVSLDLTSRPEGSGLRRSHKAVQTRCAACRLSGGLTVCVQCGRGFHRDCHIPPISSALSGEWQCMLCRDLTDVEDVYSDERPRRPSLSLLDQKKCEHLLLALMCKKYSSVLYRKVELSSHYIDITLIRGRLLRKLSPSYRTPSEFVSDIWVLLESLAKNSEESALVFKMQKYFQRKLSKIFGDALHPSLLKCPSMEDGETAQDAGDETVKVRETLKRMRAFIAANRQGLAKKACREETEPRDQSPGPA
ncbi:transcription intermediary factor 1-beta isoform X2 [Anguilla anguilla]|uniref:transcription intermediary factor 1-beta isoform X2 n=1 Tax=Anguilla anguilla TaxID=7936 RepID=UPI0015AF1B8A|nr:transcription intermediary factor 1-beta isoform X2 [Anguilla anguilla]